MSRGVYRSESFGRQLVKFDGMRWGSITPTDVDGFIDFGDRLFVFVEAKHGDSKMPRGQELALERLCDACHAPPRRYAVGFVVSHQTDADIFLMQTIVRDVRWKGEWKPATSGQSLLEQIERVRRIVFPDAPNEHAEWIAAYESVSNA